MSGRPELRCQVCGKGVPLADVVRAVELVERKDSRGNVIAVKDGYEAMFHPRCWDDIRLRRVYTRRNYKRRPGLQRDQ